MKTEIDFTEAGKGLWYNIQKKKERMGKNYKPAKPGDKDYPKPDALKKAQAEEWDGITFWQQDELLKIWPELSKADDVTVDKDPEEMLFNSQEAAEMAVTIFSSGVDKLAEMIKAVKSDATIAARCSDPWALSDIALLENYINSIHGYLMYPKEGFASEDEMEEDDDREYKNGEMVKNINPSCDHYGSEGTVESVEELPNGMGKVVKYKVTNDGPTYKKGDILTKTKDQLIKSKASYESEEEYKSMEQTEGKNFRQFLQKCIPSKDGSDKEKFQSCLLDYKKGQPVKAKLFQPPLILNEHNTKLVDQAYKTIVEPSLEKEHGKRVGPFSEDDMEFQLEYQKTVHPDYKVENQITKDKIFTPKELNKDLKEYPGNSKR